MNLESFLAEQEVNDARTATADAFATGETPEQAALRLRKARAFQLPYAAADAVTPEEMAAKKAESIAWADLYARAPQLVRAMGDPAFANLVKDDIENQGVIEAAVWKLSPEPGKTPDGWWSAARNSAARGMYSFFGDERNLEEAAENLHRLDELGKRIAAGESDASIFGSEADPMGIAGRKIYDDQMAHREDLLKQISAYARRTAWANRMRSLFPASESTQRFQEAETLGSAVSRAAENPVLTLMDIGPESLVQFAPAVAALAVNPVVGGGLLTGAAVQGTTSFLLSQSSNFAQRISELGVDLTDDEAVSQFFSNPENYGAIAESYRLATQYAAPIALLDAASLGVASRTLIPQAVSQRMFQTAARREFANMGAQLAVQGGMGGAGEAFGQLASDGEITSWSDVVAEVIGEQFTAPVEVATTGLRVRFEADRARLEAERKAQAARDMTEALRRSTTAELDPETQAEQVRRVGEAAGVTSVSVDGRAFFQKGLDKRYADMPALVEGARTAAATGADVTVPIETYARMAARDENGELLEITAFGDGPSVADASAEAAARGETARARTAAAVDSVPDQTFRSEVAEIGREVGAQLRETGVVRDEALGIQAIVQAFAASLAQAAGISPRVLWNEFGFRIEGVNEAADGKKGEFLPDARTIRRWKNADRSTLIHEVGHAFLDMRLRIAEKMLAEAQEGRSANEAQAAYLEDAGRVLEWLGVKDFAEWNALSEGAREEVHEKFARSFEAYMMQGKAPNGRLTKAFSDFSRLLAGTYTAVSAIPGAVANAETSSMFDTFFLSREQAGRAAMRSPAGTLLADDAVRGALTPEETAEALRTLEEVGQQAIAEQIERNRRNAEALHRLRTRILNAIKKGASEELRRIRDRLKETRPYRAWQAVKNGVVREGEKVSLKPFTGDLEMLGYTPEQIEYLHRKGLAVKQSGRQPMSADAIAEALDYANANELVDDLLRVADAADWLDEEAANRLLMENPDVARLTDPKAQDERADAAVYNEARERILRTELKALARLAREEARNVGGALAVIADRVVQSLPVGELRPRRYITAARRAAREAQEAFAKGDYRTAYQAKRCELYNAAVARRIKETAARFAKKRANLNRYRRKEIRAMDGRFLETIQRALAQLGIFSRESLGLNPAKETFGEMLNGLADETGFSFDTSPELVAAVTSGDPSYLGTVRGMNEFFDLIDELDARGRKEKEIGVGKAKEALDAVQTEGARVIRETAEARGRKPRSEEGVREEEGIWAGIKDQIKRIGIQHARMSAIVAVLDGGWRGFLTEHVIYPSDRAAAREESIKHETTKKLAKIFAPVEKSLRSNRKHTSGVLGVALSTREAFFSLLNYGNEGNRLRCIRTMEKLSGRNLRGEFDPSNPASVAEAEARADRMMQALWAEYLTDEHYAAAEKVWALFGELQKETEKVARRITGRTPLWVEPRPLRVMTADGERTLAGGYYPIRYDRELSSQGAELGAVASANDLRPVFASGGVNDGHLQRRVRDNVNPLALTSRALGEGLDQQIHYIAWAETLNDLRKIFGKRGAISQAVMERYGARYKQAIDAWLRTCRNGAGESSQLDALPNFLRMGVSVTSIGLNLVTALIQVTGATQSVAYLGPKWAARGFGEFMSMGPAKAIRWVQEVSPQMAARTRTQFREVAEIQGRLNGTQSNWREALMRAAYVPVAYMQLFVDIPTWLGAYERALSEGKAETLARDEADRAVMNSQGSGRLSDLSAFERGGAWTRLFTVFYTFFNTALNMAVVSGRTETGMKRAMQIMTVLILQPVLETFLRAAVEQIGKDDDDWLEKAAQDVPMNVATFNLGMLFGARELTSFIEGYSYRGPTGLRKLTDLGNLGLALKKDDWDERTLRAAVTAIGSWAGIPAVPVNRLITGYTALSKGKTDNPLVLLSGFKKD